jgi:hypothetical protein
VESHAIVCGPACGVHRLVEGWLAGRDSLESREKSDKPVKLNPSIGGKVGSVLPLNPGIAPSNPRLSDQGPDGLGDELCDKVD